jgi:hypothetical protein
MSSQNPTAIKIAEKVVERFKRENADFLACQQETPAQILDLASADASLDPEIISDLELYSNPEVLDQSDFLARKMQREDLERVLYNALAKCVLRLYHSELIHPVIKATEEANQQYQLLKIAAGIEKAPPPPPKPLSAAEQLDAEIKDDWIRLPADKVNQKKRTNPRYAKRLNELLETDEIRSQISQMHDGSKGL